ncbi:MAG: hypothetical protein ACRDMY_03255 [Gaiellaceae bacterium]
MAAPEPFDRPDPRTRRRLIWSALALLLLLVVGVAGVAGYWAHENKKRADRWEARAAELELSVASLNELLGERSQALNERTQELNAMAVKVRQAERSIVRSEADVRSLERRQRQLADEKAQVEDARAQLALERDALGAVITAAVECNSGMNELLDYVLADDFASANAAYPAINTDCRQADSELSSYLSVYGG